MPLELIGLEWQFVRERFILALGGWFNSGSKIGDTPLLNKNGDLPSAVLGRGKLSLKDIEILEDGPDYKSKIRKIHKKYDTSLPMRNRR